MEMCFVDRHTFLRHTPGVLEGILVIHSSECVPVYRSGLGGSRQMPGQLRRTLDKGGSTFDQVGDRFVHLHHLGALAEPPRFPRAEPVVRAHKPLWW